MTLSALVSNGHRVGVWPGRGPDWRLWVKADMGVAACLVAGDYLHCNVKVQGCVSLCYTRIFNKKLIKRLLTGETCWCKIIAPLMLHHNS